MFDIIRKWNKKHTSKGQTNTNAHKLCEYFYQVCFDSGKVSEQCFGLELCLITIYYRTSDWLRLPHGDFITWKRFPCSWALVGVLHLWVMDFLSRNTVILSELQLLCCRGSCWTNIRITGDLRHHNADVTSAWWIPVQVFDLRLEPNLRTCPDIKVHGANMGVIWGRQDPCGPHVGPVNFAMRVAAHVHKAHFLYAKSTSNSMSFLISNLNVFIITGVIWISWIWAKLHIHAVIFYILIKRWDIIAQPSPPTAC